jgi:hypothetical protein
MTKTDIFLVVSGTQVVDVVTELTSHHFSIL